LDNWDRSEAIYSGILFSFPPRHTHAIGYINTRKLWGNIRKLIEEVDDNDNDIWNTIYHNDAKPPYQVSRRRKRVTRFSKAYTY